MQQIELPSNEKWIKGGEGRYSVSTEGVVFSHITGKKPLSGGVLTGWASRQRRAVCLQIDGKTASRYVAKLVAEAFLPVPDYLVGKKVTLQYKNNNSLDCGVDNLFWMSRNELSTQFAVQSTEDRKKPPTGEELQYVLYGVGEPITTNRWNSLFPYLTKDDLIKAGIPSEYLVLAAKECSLSKAWEFHKSIFSAIDDGLTLKACGHRCGVDQSFVSIVKNGKRLVEQRKVYDKWKESHTS